MIIEHQCVYYITCYHIYVCGCVNIKSNLSNNMCFLVSTTFPALEASQVKGRAVALEEYHLYSEGQKSTSENN